MTDLPTLLTPCTCSTTLRCQPFIYQLLHHSAIPLYICDTIVYERKARRPVWWFGSKDGTVKRRHNRHVTIPEIISCFNNIAYKNHSRGAIAHLPSAPALTPFACKPCEIIATFTFDSVSLPTDLAIPPVVYLTSSTLEVFLSQVHAKYFSESTPPSNGLYGCLQPFILPLESDHNTVYKCSFEHPLYSTILHSSLSLQDSQSFSPSSTHYTNMEALQNSTRINARQNMNSLHERSLNVEERTMVFDIPIPTKTSKKHLHDDHDQLSSSFASRRGSVIQSVASTYRNNAMKSTIFINPPTGTNTFSSEPISSFTLPIPVSTPVLLSTHHYHPSDALFNSIRDRAVYLTNHLNQYFLQNSIKAMQKKRLNSMGMNSKELTPNALLSMLPEFLKADLERAALEDNANNGKDEAELKEESKESAIIEAQLDEEAALLVNADALGRLEMFLKTDRNGRLNLCYVRNAHKLKREEDRWRVVCAQCQSIITPVTLLNEWNCDRDNDGS